MTPYLTQRERKERIAGILGPESKSSETQEISNEEL
jgi:hypothetical protein